MDSQKRVARRVRDDILARRRTWYYQSCALWAKRKEEAQTSSGEEPLLFDKERHGFVHSNR